jgi:diguanylate cyclase (GGDEF)-like protein
VDCAAPTFRWAFDELAEKEWKREARQQAEFSILMIDVDHFKRFNDEHGHLQGDHALMQVAQCIKRHLKRPADSCARFGGEEFAVLLPAIPTAGAMKVAEEIRIGVGLMSLGDPTLDGLTLSIGVTTTMPQLSSSFKQALKAADTALYLSKQLGRNRVEFHVQHSEV